MKKTLALVALLSMLAIYTPQKTSATIDFNSDPSTDPNNFIWSIMSQLTAPDDANCATVAATALTGQDLGPGAPPIDQVASQICSGLATMRTQMQQGMSHGSESVSSNLWQASNWHQVQNLYFEHSVNGVPNGKIAFTKPIDFMSYNFMHFMQNFGNEMETGQGILGLDATTVGGMKGYGAILTMYNLPDFNNPTILVDGKADTGGVVSNIVYDKTNHTITFDAAHFTTFKVVEGSTNTGNAPKVRKITSSYVKADGQTEIKMVISGDHFNRNTKIRLDGKKSIHLVITNNLMTAYFKLPSNLVKIMVYLRLSNPNDQVKREKINLTKIPLSKLY